MTTKPNILLIFIFITFTACKCNSMVHPPATEFKVNTLFADHMVLQREMKTAVWGTALPGNTVTVKIHDQTHIVTADKNGKWKAWIKALPIGGPYRMKIITKDKTITFKDILCGDVWLCSGQSNMQWIVSKSKNPTAEINAAKYPEIRFFQAKCTVSMTPLDNVTGKWKVCSPRTVRWFSAVGYFFGRDLYKQLKIPIGLIHSSWGGTPAESWTPKEIIEADQILKPILNRHIEKIKNFSPELFVQKMKKFQKKLAIFKKKRLELKASKAKKQIALPRYPSHPYNCVPGTLYNAMIHPLLPYGIKGVIWYQGESNSGRAYQYRTLLPAMINSWRKAWNQGNFPFLIVQLANYRLANKNPVESTWAELREAQSLTSRKLSNCGLVVTIDIGETNNVHPKNKQDVAKRLALAAMKIAYGKNLVFSGPTFQSYLIKGNKIILKFANVGDGLVAKGGPLRRFQIAGKDRKFVWAKSEINGSSVIVSNPKLTAPVAVRYAWSNNPEGCNLYNKEGLPASPFRTDNWKGITDDKY